MDVENILNRVRVLTDDNVSPYLWSNADIVEYLNIVIDEIAKETHCIRDSYTEACCKITLSEDTADYALHAKIIHVLEAKCEGAVENLDKKDVDYLQRIYPTWRTDDSSYPILFVLDKRPDYITLYPTPDDTYTTLWLTVTRYPLTALSISDPAQQSELDAVPGIPTMYHDRVINGILYYCYQKRDEDTYNPKLVAEYLQKYDSDIEMIKRDEIKLREVERVVAPSEYHL